MQSSERFYIPQLDGLRCVAFLLVYFSHAGGFSQVEHLGGPLSIAAKTYNNIAFFGWTGVDLFFVLSAYLITTLLLREEAIFGRISVSRFMMRRCLRIWPVYYFAVIVALVFFAPDVSFYWDFIRKNVIWMGLFGSNLAIAWEVVNPPIPALPLWSVSLEEQFYLFWVVCLFLTRSVWARWAIVAAGAILTIGVRQIILMQSEGPVSHTWFYATYAHLDPLVVGIAVAFLQELHPEVWKRLTRYRWTAAAMGLLLLLSAASIFGDGPRSNSPFVYTFVAVGYGLCLFALISSKTISKPFAHPLMVASGLLTFELYVVHGFIIFGMQILAKHALDQPHQTAANLLIGLPLTYVTAWLLKRHFSDRFLALKPRFTRIKSGHDNVATRKSLVTTSH